MDYLTPEQLAARYLGAISVRTLANWRSKGEGPAYTKIGGRVLYALADVAAWEKSRVRETTGRALACIIPFFELLAA